MWYFKVFLKTHLVLWQSLLLTWTLHNQSFLKLMPNQHLFKNYLKNPFRLMYISVTKESIDAIIVTYLRSMSLKDRVLHGIKRLSKMEWEMLVPSLINNCRHSSLIKILTLSKKLMSFFRILNNVFMNKVRQLVPISYQPFHKQYSLHLQKHKSFNILF